MNPTPERFLQIEAIFDEVLEAPDEARAGLIDTRCYGDSDLAAEVSSLLMACEAQEHLTASQQLQPDAGQDNRPSRKRIGPYELDRLLGRGGMGAVYLAHRADGQFEQKVAIKLIDLPLATDLFRERFRQERQILAELQHPYIARLLDGGVTPQGDLYLVMEYVDGVPIHRFCEEQRLSVPQRIALFMRVCEAVQFAHQHFVVHRDLKPDNILVAADGTPRLLDFGTAKLLSPSPLGSDSKLTREGYQSFTPQYASPEQVLGNPITTASDTYSLGVLLYLLLAGTVPYELKELTTAEMLRVICEEPPRKPPREADSDRRLDADLEAILLKALRKEPQKRYLSADQFSTDLRAYLQGLPVVARRGTLRYRAGKFIRRRRFSVAASALLAASLIAGVVGVLWQARVANAERRKAEARSADLRLLSKSLLSELDEAIQQLPGSTGAQKLLVTRVLEHLDRMASDARGDRQTQLDLVDAYTRLGNLQGNDYDQNLGDPAGALVSIGKAIAIAEPLVAEKPKDREALRALAVAVQSRSEILWLTGKTSEAVSVLQEALNCFQVLASDPYASAALLTDAATAYDVLGDELGHPRKNSMKNLAGALTAYRMNLSLVNRALSADPGFSRAIGALAIATMKIGDVEMETDPAQSLKDLQLALQRLDALPNARQGNLSVVRLRGLMLSREANALVQVRDYSAAIPLFEKAIDISRRLAAADPQDWRSPADMENAMNAEASAFEAAADPVLAVAPHVRRRNLDAAQTLLTRAMALIEIGLKKEPANDAWRAVMADVQVRLGSIQFILRSAADPTALSKQGLATIREIAGKDAASPAILDQAANAFVKVEPASLRDLKFAIACAERAIAMSPGKTPSMLLTLAQAYRAAGQIEKSRATARQGLALLPPPQPGGVKPNIRKLLEKASE
jgi:tetratricopeptide (TPR) repeat protein